MTPTSMGFTLGGPIFKDKLFGFGGGTFARFYGTTQATPVELPDATGFATLKTLAAAGNAQANLLSQLSQQRLVSRAGALHCTLTCDQPRRNARRQLAARLRLGLQHHHRNLPAQRRPRAEPRHPVDLPHRLHPARRATPSRFRYIHDRQSLVPYFPLNPTSLPGFDAQNFGVSELGGGSLDPRLHPKPAQ